MPKAFFFESLCCTLLGYAKELDCYDIHCIGNVPQFCFYTNYTQKFTLYKLKTNADQYEMKADNEKIPVNQTMYAYSLTTPALKLF